jgi:enoyl-CoA hydratase/carnithine racemase
MNAIGELCAQFRQGPLAMIRRMGADKAILRVEAYHAKHPAAARKAWYPDALRRIAEPEWQQLYVNAEHDGGVGVITISRESYNHDVDAELNRAIDWLVAADVDRVILSGDFHLSTQMVGADTSEFLPALDDVRAGQELAERWTATARRLHSAFNVSVGVISGKRCLGGMLELVTHCHYVLAVNAAGHAGSHAAGCARHGGLSLDLPQGATPDWPKPLQLLMSGRPVKAEDVVGWLTDFSGPIDGVLSTARALAPMPASACRPPCSRRAPDGDPPTLRDCRRPQPGHRRGPQGDSDCVRGTARTSPTRWRAGPALGGVMRTSVQDGPLAPDMA